jgi:predicted alpha/beta hydrolase family esterase
MPNSIVFILPGLYNSGPQHWQSHWEQEYGFTRIHQQDWETPVCEDWITTLDQAVTQHPLDQVILAGHSLACCTVAHWAYRFNRPIKGALLVGPSDVEAPSYPPGTTGFQPMPLNKLPFPAVTVASTNDEYVTVERAQQFADAWGSKLVVIGDYGHINSASNLGNWPEGLALLKQLY